MREESENELGVLVDLPSLQEPGRNTVHGRVLVDLPSLQEPGRNTVHGRVFEVKENVQLKSLWEGISFLVLTFLSF